MIGYSDDALKELSREKTGGKSGDNNIRSSVRHRGGQTDTRRGKRYRDLVEMLRTTSSWEVTGDGLCRPKRQIQEPLKEKSRSLEVWLGVEDSSFSAWVTYRVFPGIKTNKKSQGGEPGEFGGNREVSMRLAGWS